VSGAEKINIQSVGPFPVKRGIVLNVSLRIDGMTVEEPEATILWAGGIGSASFKVEVPPRAKEGSPTGVAFIYASGLRIAHVDFELTVGATSGPAKQVPSRYERYRKAFASYSSQDRNDVLARIQGMQKIAPSLEIFLDVLKLRSGQDWQQELWKVIPENDVFYLFWSQHARDSDWVEKEWRCALSVRGIDFIDPCPLVSPDVAPPPPELSSKHFNDWVLAFMRAKT